MREDVEQFLSELHAMHLKPLGFRKVRHRFERAREGYVEHVHVDGSSWNAGAGTPWRFYVDVAVELPDLPTHSLGWGRANARGRIRDLVPDAPGHFDLDASTRSSLMALLPSIIVRASAALAAVIPAARAWAERGRRASLYALVRGSPPPSADP